MNLGQLLPTTPTRLCRTVMFLSAFCINGLSRLKKSFHFCYDFEQKSTKLLLKESWYLCNRNVGNTIAKCSRHPVIPIIRAALSMAFSVSRTSRTHISMMMMIQCLKNTQKSLIYSSFCGKRSQKHQNVKAAGNETFLVIFRLIIG